MSSKLDLAAEQLHLYAQTASGSMHLLASAKCMDPQVRIGNAYSLIAICTGSTTLQLVQLREKSSRVSCCDFHGSRAPMCSQCCVSIVRLSESPTLQLSEVSTSR